MENKHRCHLGMAGFPADRFGRVDFGSNQNCHRRTKKELTMGKTLKLCAHKPFYF
jgi:hypothetical protein